MSQNSNFFKNNNTGIELPDFSGYNITRFWSFYKTNLASLQYAIRIRRSDSVGNFSYVFWDDLALISSDSFINNTTTKPSSGNTIATLEATGNDHYVQDWYCQITGHSVSGSTLKNIIIESSALTEKDSRISLKLLGTGGMEGTALTELGSATDFTVYMLVSSDTTGIKGVFSITGTTGGDNDNFSMYLDKNVSKRGAIYRASGVNYTADNLSAISDTDTHILTASVNRTSGDLDFYLDGVIQNNVSIANETINDVLMFFDRFVRDIPITGNANSVVIASEAHNATEVLELSTKLATQANITI